MLAGSDSARAADGMAKVATCQACGHAAHAGKCPHLTRFGRGWMICQCGARAPVSRVDQQAIANAFDVLRRCLLSPARERESRAYGDRVQLAVCGRVCNPTVC